MHTKCGNMQVARSGTCIPSAPSACQVLHLHVHKVHGITPSVHDIHREFHTKCSICMPNLLSCHTCCATCKCPTLSSAFEVMCKVSHKVSQNVYTKHVEFGTQSGMTSSVHDITPKSITWLDSGYKTQVCKNPDT